MAPPFKKGVRTLPDGTRVCALISLGCERPFYADLYCQSHYNQKRKGEAFRPILVDLDYPGCCIPGCISPAATKTGSQLCNTHVTRNWFGKDLESPIVYKNAGFNEEGTHRRCKGCKEEKPLSEFYLRNRSTGHKSWATKCKVCFIKEVKDRARRRARATH